MIEDCNFSASGDDNIGMFRVNGGIIKNCKISDAFARGILLYECTNICLQENELIRNPILWEGGDGVSKCDGSTGMDYNQEPNNHHAEFNVYPNPFKNCFNIELLNGGSTKLNLQISNLYGESLLVRPDLELEHSMNTQICFHTFTEGTYLLTLFNENLCWTKKILKLR